MINSFTLDDTPVHADKRRSSLRDAFPTFGIFDLMEGVILKARFKDDSENVSKEWTEYDILEVSTRQLYQKARLGSLLGGIANFEETVLAETTGTTDGSQLVIEDASAVRGIALEPDPSAGITPTESYNLNGERVMFGCLGGAYSSPVIVGILPHPGSKFSAKRSEAPRQRSKYNGWTTEINKSKDLKIFHEDGRELSLKSDGSIVFRNKDNHHFQISTDGSIEVVQKTGTDLRLGSSAATKIVLRGVETNSNIQTVMTALTTACAAISTWVNASGAGNPTLNATLTTAMTTAITAVQAVLTPALTAALSPNVKVP